MTIAILIAYLAFHCTQFSSYSQINPYHQTKEDLIKEKQILCWKSSSKDISKIYQLKKPKVETNVSSIRTVDLFCFLLFMLHHFDFVYYSNLRIILFFILYVGIVGSLILKSCCTVILLYLSIVILCSAVGRKKFLISRSLTTDLLSKLALWKVQD